VRVTVTRYECGHRESATVHDRATRGRTVRVEEGSELHCNRCRPSQPLSERGEAVTRALHRALGTAPRG
jgi:hypothetical protein